MNSVVGGNLTQGFFFFQNLKNDFGFETRLVVFSPTIVLRTTLIFGPDYGVHYIFT